MKEPDRLRWRCRRGMLELDLILARFLDKHLTALDAKQRTALDRLLQLPDNDLLDLVMARTRCDDDELNAMLVMLQAA